MTALTTSPRDNNSFAIFLASIPDANSAPSKSPAPWTPTTFSIVKSALRISSPRRIARDGASISRIVAMTARAAAVASAVPLNVLEEEVDRYIAAKKG